LDVLCVDGDNPLVSQMRATRVGNADDISPFYVMSLPSGFRFNI
jgi:hypothetical protein